MRRCVPSHLSQASDRAWWRLGSCRDVIMSGADTNLSAVAQRLNSFGRIIILRPDGYIAHALTGEAIQRAGRVEFIDGALRAGGLSTGTFYYSDSGVFYRANDNGLGPGGHGRHCAIGRSSSRLRPPHDQLLAEQQW
jgi:hypothetical protein